MKKERELDVEKILERFTTRVVGSYKKMLLEILNKRLEEENKPQPNLPNKVANAYRMGVNDGTMTGLNEARKLIQGTTI